MVAIVSGTRPGLDLSSREVLGQAGVAGNAAEGRNGQGVYVNVANGLLVLQNRDELLVSRGEDAAVLRTYNSAGQFNDDNGDNWASGVASLQLAGVLNAAGSSISRTDRDGSTAVYGFDAARGLYVTTEGGGAYDTIAYVAADAQFEWRDGSTGVTQRFEGAGARRLLSCKDAAGNTLGYAYGANGFLASVTTASGESTFYDYSGNNLTQVRTVVGTVTTTRVRYGYDLSNRLATVTVDLSPEDGSVADGKVYQTTYTYDGTSKRIASVTQTDGSNLAFTYVDAGGGNFKVATVRDGLNQATTFTYGLGFTTVTDAQGLVTRYDVDASGRLAKITAPAAGGTTPSQQFAYNANGDVISVTDGQGRTVSFGYDANGNQVLQRDQAGNTVTRSFDARNQLLTESVHAVPDPDGAGIAQPAVPLTTRNVYDAAGRSQLRFVLSPEGRVTEHRYDGFGQRVATITYTAAVYPTAALASTAAPSEADLAAWAGLQNPAATQRVEMSYDARGQLQSRTTYASVTATGAGVADGTQSLQAFVHDQAGLLLKTVSATGAATSYTYDGLGRVLSTLDALGAATVTQYQDAAGKTVLTLANGLVRTSSYDRAGRLVSVAEGNAAAAALGETKYFYDASNRLRMTQDPTGVRRWILYDPAGRKEAEVDGNGTMTEYTYDGSGRVTSVITYAGAVNTGLLVDLAGFPLASARAATVRPLASAADQREWRSYDAAGRLLRSARSYAAGNTVAVTENRYDGASRLVQVVRYANPLAADTPAVAPGAVGAPVASTEDRSTRNFYDADGLLLGTLDGEGYLTAFNYTAAGQLAESVRYATATAAALRASATLAQLAPLAAAGDARTVNLYDGKGQRIATVDAEGYLTESVYGNDGNPTTTVRYANRVAVALTAHSTLATIRPASTPQDRTTSRSYDALGRLAQETSPEGLRTAYGYDKVGNLVSTVRSAVLPEEARSLLAQYDLQGRRIAELSAQGAALLVAGQTQAQVDAIWAQHGLRHTYDAAGRRTSTTDAAGNRTLFYYDADGALTHTVNALGEVAESRYDAQGRLIEQSTYSGRIATAGLTGGLVTAALGTAVAAIAGTQTLGVRYTYTSDDRIATATDALGNVNRSSYNAFGDQIASEEGLGGGLALTQAYTVDRRGLRTGTTVDAANAYGLQAISSTAYDAFGRAVRSVDANGAIREQAFDRLGRAVTQRDALNAQSSRSYDAFDRVLTETDALGKVTTYAYDLATRTVAVTTPEGIRTTTAYTRHGQVQSITDGNGQVSTYTYDRDGHLVQTRTPLTTTSAAFDGAGRQIETTDARGVKVAYAYDAANRVLTRRIDPAGLNLTTSYAYDGKGQQVSVTDASGIVTTRQFDVRGRVLRETIDPTGLNLQTAYSYDARGKVLTVTSPGGNVTQYVYDVLGRRVQERVDPAGLNLTRSWAYDRNGNAVSSTDALGGVTRYAYDAENRLVFTLDPLGNLRQNVYDAAGRVTRTVAYVTPIATIGLGPTSTAAEIQPLIVSQAAQDLVENRVYDKDNRLAATVDGTGAVTRYSYDANGNVVARTAYANRINLATWVAGSLPAPVADGAHDATVRTIYDALDRATYTMDGNGAVVAQTYDGNGNVLQRTAYATAIPTNTVFTQAAVATAVAAVASAARDAAVRNTYDAANRLTWSADGTGAVTQRVYDKNGNVVRQLAYANAIAATAAPSSVIASAGDRATSMAYDNANRLVFQVDALRGVTEQVYDANGKVVRRVAYAAPVASVPALGTAGTAAAIRTLVVANAAADRTTRYGYDAAGRRSLVIDALGAVTETQYDAAGNAIAVVRYADPVNAATLAPVPTLAAMKALVAPNASADRMTRSAYDAAGRLVYTVDPVGAVKASQYNGAGLVTRTTRYAKPIAATTPNTAAGIAAALVANAALDQVDTFSYNAAGLLIATTDAVAGTESYSYDAVGRRLTLRNKRGFVWSYSYDAAGRMLTETTPPVSLTGVTPDAAGNLVAGATADAPIVTRLAYDALGNLTQRTEAAGRPEERSTRYEYDAAGRQVRVIYPPVGVYNAALDAVTTNGATGVASRAETLQTLETRTFYDTLGNAVASRDVGGALSQKAYDLLGRVAYEVDAMGYVTRYGRNAFGEVTSLTRYAVATTLATLNVTTGAQAAAKTLVESTINAVGVDHSRDRVLLTAYDRAGRVIETSEPTVYVYDSSAATGLQTGVAGKKTRNTYDAFGQLVQVRNLRNANTDTWTTTTHYFDAAGQETATIDALGYLTRRSFDAFGNVVQSTEYATAVAAAYTLATYAVPLPSADDRTTNFAYDRLNRKTTESRLNVEYSLAANGTSTRGTLSTSYGYDALGNQTRVTDAAGSATFTYYDALGRVKAVAAPSRTSTVSGLALVPLTEFRRDAYGNVAVKLEYANGAATATQAAYTAGLADAANDRSTLAIYDSFGRSIQGADANGANDFTSYDAYGHVAKHWQGVTGNDGVTRTAFEVNAYDKLGQLVETRTPASTTTYSAVTGLAVVAQSGAGVVSTGLEYNAFGELTRKGTQGGRQEYFDYDNAGRLWRTNSGDGVDRISLYDALGNATAEIRSSGAGRDNIDIKNFASAQAADANPYTRRVDLRYDALGRVTARTEAAREELQGGVAVMRQFVSAGVLVSAATEDGLPLPGSFNKISLGWNSLAPLGSGDVKVYLEYRTPQVTVLDEGIAVTTGGTARSTTSVIFNGDASASGLTMQWPEVATSADAGIGSITRVVVYKKDVNGNWQVAVDQAPGYGANEISVAAPPNATTGLTLQLRAAGSPGDTGWWTAGLVNFGNGLRFDARGVAPGSYEYRVTSAPANEPARVTGTGTVTLSQPPLNSITAPITFGAAGAGVLAWAAPGATYSQELRYRVSGSAGAWSTLAVLPRNNGLYDGVDTSGLAGGTYQFELLWTVNGQGVPSAHATGAFTVVPPIPPQWVPPVNLPNITGVSIGTGVVGGTVIGHDEGGAPIYSGGTTVPAIAWTAAGATVAQYRVPGGVWANLVIDSSGQHLDESGFTGVQKALLNGIPPGTYEVQVLAGSPPKAQATGKLTIYAQSPGSYQTVYVQVPVSTPVIAFYAPVYETRYGTRQVAYQVWVNDPPYQVITGYDESGVPVYTWIYPGHYETRYYTETYAYQVQVGSTPVYATDESGNILYSISYVTQAQQVWVPGTTPAPTIVVTTPPYTPGYWTAWIPAQYGVSVTTAAGSKAISTTSGAVIAQAAGVNGDDRWLRPTVLQKVDRWGNVLEVTDPRATYWKTTYRYNSNNQLVQQTQPDVAGSIGASSPVTSIYYDRAGRQVAVKDANGFVNGQLFDAGGNLVQETHADGGVVAHAFNAFGDKVRTTDAMGKVVVFSYDRMGYVLRLVKGTVGVYRVNGTNSLELVATRNVTESWSYDQLGRKLTQTNGNGDVLSYTYDLRGNVVETRQPLGQAVRAAYDAQGRKIAEVDANGYANSWTYDYFGLLRSHVDLGGARYTYAYDNARQLISQTSTRGQNISYSYDAAGQVTTIRDWALDKTTAYAYDLSGRKIRERVVQQGITYQDNHLAYDAQGNLRDVADARAHVVMEYDRAGNRTRVATFVNYQGTAGETSSSSDRYFKYDAMNRQVVVDAVDALGNLGTQGHQITYDKNGNRISDRYWGNMVVTSGGVQTIVGYNEDGSAIYGTTLVTYLQTTGYSTEEYRYDNLNRLQSVVKDGTQIDVRYYDGADRAVQSGPAGNLPLKYAEIINAGLAPDQMNGKETRINRYDANGRLLHQRVLKSDNTLKADVSWDVAEAYSDGTTSLRSDGYDAAGNALSYVSKSYEGGAVTEFTTALARYEGYQGATINGVSSKQNPGATTELYDANGFLVGLTDSTQANNNRTFVNDANGRALFVNQAGNVQRQMIVNGEVLGLYGAGVDPNKPSSGANNNPNFANVVDFDFGYAKISANYPTPSPGAYTVRTGDTLQTIAQGAYGDSSLWYRIAEANGLMSNSDLKVGQTLNIPNRVGTVSNNSSTFKPYDPTKIEGDKTPSLATPEKKGGCGGIGKILMVVVAIAVTIWTAGALSGVATGFAQTMSAGLGVMTGGTAGGAVGIAAAGALNGMAAVGAMAVAGAAGSIASQAVGLATGTIDKFDWRGVALSAIASGVTAGLQGGMLGSVGNNLIVRAAIGSAITQGIGVVIGLQKKFDWRGVAASAVGAGVGQAVGPIFGQAFGSSPMGQMAARFATGLTSSAAVAVMRGGKVAIQQVAADAFGNAMGEALVDISAGVPTSGEDFPRSEIREEGIEAALTLPADGRGSPVQAISAFAGVPIDEAHRLFDAGYRMTSEGVRGPESGGYGNDPQQVALGAIGLLGGAGTEAGIVGGGSQVGRPSGAGAPPPIDIKTDMPRGAPGYQQAGPTVGWSSTSTPILDSLSIDWSKVPPLLALPKILGDFLTFRSPSDILGGNLEAAGRARDSSYTRPADTDAHHIVPWKDGRYQNIRDKLGDYDIDINSAANGVFLPNKRDSEAEGSYHPRLNNKDYHAQIQEDFQQVNSKADALRMLEKIRSQLEKGTYPGSRPPTK